MKPTVSDRIAGRPSGRLSDRWVVSSVANLAAGQAVEQGRLASVGVADQGDGGERGALARRPVQGAGAAHLLQLELQLDDSVGDLAPVEFDLGFTGTAGAAGSAALALQVGPGAHQPRALVFEPRQFDLQLALGGAGSAGEDLQDQAGAVHHLGFPGLFQVALLDRRQLVVDHDEVAAQLVGQVVDLLDLALAEQGSGHGAAQIGQLGPDHKQVQGLG
jgi:hypothetical protein